MFNLNDAIGHKRDVRSVIPSEDLVSDSLVGIEVELEGVTNQGTLDYFDKNLFDYWNPIEDGSLRDGGIEYTLVSPLGGVDLTRALDELEEFIESNEIVPTLSDRTSLHIHVDIRDLDVQQFRAFIILYMIFEKVLFNYCGKSREDNIFCLSFGNSQGDMSRLGNLFSYDNPQDINYVLSDASRYSACNINSAIKYGSLEFRGHKGTYNPEDILRWINILLLIKEKAKSIEYMDVKALPTIVSNYGAEELFNDTFKQYSRTLEYPGFIMDIIDSIRLSQDAIHYYTMEYANVITPLSGEADFFETYVKEKYPKKHKSLFGDIPPEPEEEWEVPIDNPFDGMTTVELDDRESRSILERERLRATIDRLTNRGILFTSSSLSNEGED